MSQSFDVTTDPPQDSSSGTAPWSASQLNRLHLEWQNLVRCYAYHPFVRILSFYGAPPTAYEVEFRVRTLEIDAAGRLGYAPACSIKLQLSSDFPHRAPQIVPLQAIFHPNVDTECVQIFPPWKPSQTLVDVIERVGKLLAYQSIDPQDVWNPVAMEWVIANPGHVPTDPTANLANDAGGNPIERICRYGPVTLPAIREQLHAFSQSLLDPGRTIDPTDLENFCLRIRLALRVFLDAGIPASLATEANELNAWINALPEAEAVFAKFRSAISAGKSADRLITSLNEAARQLDQQLSMLQQIIRDEPSDDPRLLLQELPNTADLQKSQGVLRGLLVKAEQRLATARALDETLRATTSDDSLPVPLQKMIDHLKSSQILPTQQTNDRLQAIYSISAEIVARGRDESFAVYCLVLWREFVDTRHRAQLLAKQIIEWGSPGVQAYFLNNESGRHGPFDFEQQVDMGTSQIAIRKVNHHAIEAIDLMRGVVMGRSETGNLSVFIPGEQPAKTFPTTFCPTPRCDDLALQLEYAVTRTRAILEKLFEAQPTEVPISACAKHAAALASPSAMFTIATEHQAVTTAWTALAADLRSLAPFKERMATYHLLARVHESIPLFLEDRSRSAALQAKCDKRIAEILARGSTDAESGRVIIPGKHHKEYESLLSESETIQIELDHLDASIRMLCEHVAARMAVKKDSASPIGSAKIPQLALLPEMAVDMAELSDTMNDQAVLQWVSAIEGMAQTQLYFGRRPTAPPIDESLSDRSDTETAGEDADLPSVPHPDQFSDIPDSRNAPAERTSDLLLDRM